MAELLTIEEARNHLRVSRGTLFNLLGSGELSKVKIGSRTLIRRSDVDALIKRGAAQTSSPAAA